MNDDNGDSFIEGVFLIAIMLYLLYWFTLAAPAVPYVDMLLTVILHHSQHISFLHDIPDWGGRWIMIASMSTMLLVVTTCIVYLIILAISKTIFANKAAMYMFMYGQGFGLIGMLALHTNEHFPITSHTDFIASLVFVKLFSIFISVSIKKAALYLEYLGFGFAIFAFVVEFFHKSIKVLNKGLIALNRKIEKSNNKRKDDIVAEKSMNNRQYDIVDMIADW